MAHVIDTTIARPGRVRATRIAAAVIAVVALAGMGSVPALVAGFADRSDVHAFHNVQWGALAGVLFAGSMLAVAFSPIQSTAAVRSIVGIGLSFVGVAGFAGVLGPETVTPLVFAIVVALLAGPGRLSGGWAPRSLPLAVLALIATIPGLVNAVVQIGFQMERSADVHATEMHYAGSAVITVAIPIVAYIVSTMPAGYRVQALLVGSATALLGIASLIILRTGAFSVIPAVLMIVWGVAFMLVSRTASANG